VVYSPLLPWVLIFLIQTHAFQDWF